MIGNISHTSQTAADVNKTGQGQAINSSPRLSVHDHEGDKTKAQSIDITASTAETHNVQLAEPASPPNPEATKQTIRTLIDAIYSNFNIPPPDNTDLAYKAIIEALQKRDQGIRERHSLENNLSMSMSEQQAQAQIEQGKVGVSSAWVGIASSLSIAAVGGAMEFGSAYNERKANIGELNEKNLPGVQADFDALKAQQKTERQEFFASHENAANADRENLRNFPNDNPAAERLQEYQANYDAMNNRHIAEATPMQDKLITLAQNVANLPREAGIALLNTSRYLSTGGQIIHRNLATTIEQLNKQKGDSAQLEQQSKGTISGAAANVYATMAQESAKEADGAVNLIAQMIEAMVKKHDMAYNTINFAAQKI